MAEEKPDWKEQPGEALRKAMDKESPEEHRLTTDSPRWGPPGTSRRVRGYPREGGEPLGGHPKDPADQ